MKTDKENLAIDGICNAMELALARAGMNCKLQYQRSIEYIQVTGDIETEISVAMSSVKAAMMDIMRGLIEPIRNTF